MLNKDQQKLYDFLLQNHNNYFLPSSEEAIKVLGFSSKKYYQLLQELKLKGLVLDNGSFQVKDWTLKT